MVPCMIVTISFEMPSRSRMMRRRVQERPQQRAEGDADRVVAAEQRDGDAGEAEAGREVEAVAE